jgi:uncharacterized repeat protein (TIGR02543 family)
MKRKFFRASWMLAIAGLVAFSFVGTSCGSDDDDTPDTPIQVEKFKVTYDSDGGSDVAAADVVKGKEADLTKKPTKSGFTFKGWSKVKGDASQIVTSLKVDADVTLYAIWEEGEAPQPDPSKNHFIVVKASDLADQEWDTQFWFSCPTKFVEGDSWEVSMKVKALHATGDVSIDTQTHKAEAGSYIHYEGIGGVAFTEEWETYTASGEFKAQQVDGDFIAFNLNKFHPANTYCFDDISFKINGQEQIKNGDIEGDDFSSFWLKEYPDPGKPVINVSAANVIADGDPIPGSAVVVEKVKITFDLNGAEGTVEPKEVTKGNEVKVADVKAPSRDGFRFLGWSTTADGEVVETYKVEADVTLYAIWQEKAADEPEDPINTGWDFTKVEKFPYYVMGYTPEYDAENGLISKHPGLNEETGELAWYQYFVADQIPTEVGKKYSIIVEIKAEAAGKMNANMGWGWGEGEHVSTEVEFTTEWTTKQFDFADPVNGTSCNVVFQPGTFESTIYIRSVKVIPQK